MVPLLALLLLGAPAAAPSPDQAVAAARAAIDDGKVEQAARIIEQALTAHGQRDLEAVWTLRVMQGEVILIAKDSAAAIDALRQELPLKYRHTEPAVRRLIYLGFAHYEVRRFDEPEAIAKKHQPHLLGEVYRAKAVVSKDVEEARKAIRFARLHNQTATEIKAYVTLTDLLIKAGRLAEAAEVGEQTLPRARFANTVQNAHGTLGWVYLELGEYERAAALFTKAETIAKNIPSTVNRVAWLIQLGNVHFSQRKYAEADRYNDLAIKAGATDLALGYAWANRARAVFEQKDFDRARQFNERARQAKRAAKDKEAKTESLLSSDIVEARILAVKEHNHAGAEKFLKSVAANSEKHALEAQTELAKLYAGWKPEQAENAFEQAIAAAHQKRGTITDKEFRLSFFNTVSDLYDSYVKFLVDRKKPEKALEVAEQSRAESLEEKWVKGPRRFDPKSVARKHRATILSYWLGKEESYLWVITAAEIRLVLLPRDEEIEKRVEWYQGIIRQGRAPGMTLYKMLVEPAKIASGARVIIVPDGRLHLLNFETLQPARDRYWIQDVITSDTPSLQLLAASRQQTTASPSSLLLVGNAKSPDPKAYPPLLNAEREMRTVGNRFPRKKVKVLKGEQATPDEYRAAAPGKFDYVHFVAHGVAGRQRPLDAYIQLARGGESYKLIARDIQNQPLNARLVTIASCEGVGTRTYTGEGVVGLAWAFLYAGADQVIASLWKVNDAATATLMEDMYAGIAARRDPAVALRDAKLKMLASKGRAALPRYWAPFVLYAGT